MQRLKFLFILQEKRGGLGVERCSSIEDFELLLIYNWILKGWRVCCCVAPGLWRALQHRRFQMMLPRLQCYLLPVATERVGQLFMFCSCFPVISSPGDTSSEE